MRQIAETEATAPYQARKTPDIEATSITAWVTLAVLLIFYLISSVDKQMVALAIVPMGQSLNLEDSELGLLAGGAFGIPYTITVLASGWLLDRYSKRLILLIAVFGWSVAAMATGIATTYEQLILARAIVGIGEGFLPPAGLALIAAVFPRHRVAMATSIFFAGANIGVMVALSLGGLVIHWLNQQGGIALPFLGHLPPWRATFVLTAFPGLALAFLALAINARASQSRPRPAMIVGDGSPDNTNSYAAYFKKRSRLILCHSIAFGTLSSACIAVMLWSPAYLERNFEWNPGRVGLTLAVGSGAGALASVLWGTLSDRLLRSGRRDAPYILYSAICALCIPLAIVSFSFAGPAMFFAFYLVTSALLFGCGGMTSAMQLSTPPQFRARVLGLQTMSAGVFGLVLAPALVPAIAQYGFQNPLAIGHSLSVVIAVNLLLTIALLLFTRNALRTAVLEFEQSEKQPSVP